MTVERLGIVYTPIECVDFIIYSIEDILREEFGTSITEENVHFLDPFTGTGTFVTRLLQSGLIKKEDMLRKYKNEIHCNELILLAYYIADVNIEAVFHEIMKPKKYECYDGICLTDTFQLNEHGDNDIFSQLFPENSERLQKQKKAPVRVIASNPPYSVGQKSANDDAQNLKYPKLDKRVSETYAGKTSAINKNSLYDSYIKAFRWASDRIRSLKEGGIVAFISNGAWLDGISQDGMRKCLQEEFTSIYVLNLRGNQRTSGEVSRKEGGKIFGSGARIPVAITFLVKNPKKKTPATIYYHDIGDYLTREQKLKIVHDSRSIKGVSWQQVYPNEKNDWINLRDGVFDTLLPLAPDSKFDIKAKSFFSMNSNGVKTQRDGWSYNSSEHTVKEAAKASIMFYNENVDALVRKEISEPNYNSEKISWTSAVLNDFKNGKKYNYEDCRIETSQYRPFFKQKLLWYDPLVERRYRMPLIYPRNDFENLTICLSGNGTKDFTCLMTNIITDVQFMFNGQCFPLYWFEERKNKQKSLFDDDSEEEYIKRDGITDWILKEVRSRYGGARNITKEMIFYYVYGILHSLDYRERFSADLKKSLPRIPIVENVNDFMDFYMYGKKLADLHLNYEKVEPYSGVTVIGDRKVTVETKRDAVTGGYIEETKDMSDYDYFRIVDKLRFKNKADKATIIYNDKITIENIPEKAYEYVVNGKSAIEWLIERCCVDWDKKSLLKNDINAWSREHHRPRYVLDLLLSVINVSVQTMDIVKLLPKVKFE